MKLFQYCIELSRADSSLISTHCSPGFFKRLIPSESVTGALDPEFSSEPVTFPAFTAFFLYRELNRSGYRVSLVPFSLIRFLSFMQRIRVLFFARMAARRSWRK